MIFIAQHIRSKTAKHILFMLCFVFLVYFGYSQTGVVNNGAKMIVNTGAVMKITGSGADYTNTTSGGSHGRIDLDGKIEIEGNWTNNASSGYVMTNINSDGIVLFNGSTEQLVLGSTLTEFENISLDNTSGLSLFSDIKVRNIFTLTNGRVVLNANSVIVGLSGSLSGTFGTTKMFVVNNTGTLRKAISGTGSFTFPIGDTISTAEYSPVSFSLVSHGGIEANSWVSAHVTNTKHPNNTSPSEFLNRYWTLTSLGINSPNYNAAYYYSQADVSGTENIIYAAEYDGASRNVYSMVDETNNILSFTGMSSFADYTGVDGTVPTVTLSTSELDPTNADPIPFTATFSEEVTGFEYTDITIDNGSTSSVSTGDNITFTFDVSPTLNGDVTVSIDAAVAKDIAGNDNVAAAPVLIEYDNINPTVDISSSEPDPTNTDVDFTVTFNEIVSGFASEDITVGNGNVSSFTEQTTGLVYNVTVTPSGDGLVTVDIASDVVTDAAGNGNNPADQFAVLYDGTSPDVTLTSTEISPTNSNPFVLTITFNEGVVGFDFSDLTVGNCTADNFVIVKTDTIFTVDISPTISDGTVTVDLDAGVVQDYAGNNNNAATQFSIDYDAVKPGVTVTSAETEPTNTNPFEITVSFDEVVTGFELIDVDVINGTASNFQNTTPGQVWTADITPSASGVITVDISADVANDVAGNGNKAATQFSITYDEDNPIISTLGPADEATGVPIAADLEINFDEPVNAVSGNISIYESTGDALVHAFDVTTDISGNGTSTIIINPSSDLGSATSYYVQVDATAFDDDAGNSFAGILDKTTWNFTTADVDDPVISILSPVDNASSVSITSDLVITFSEAIIKGTGNITIMNATTASTHEIIDVTSGQVTISTDVVTINPTNDFNGESSYYVLIDNTAFKDATSNNFAGISNSATWNFTTEDVAAPIASDLSPADDAQDVSISSNLVITFNENVLPGTGNITITNGSDVTVHETISVGSAVINNNVVTIDPTADFEGEKWYYVEIDPTAFKDASDNFYAGISGSDAWNFTIEDVTSPTVVVSTTELNPTNNSPFTVTFTFDEEVKNFTKGDITVTNGSADNLTTSDNIVWTADIIPTSEGDVTIKLIAGVVQDLSDNDNEASNIVTIEYDVTSPSVEITSAQTGAINTDLDVTVTFSEEITGFTSGNITVSNGTITNFVNQVAGTTWDVTISPTSDGAVTSEIIADEVTDQAGNGNTASNLFTIIYDQTGPQIQTVSPDYGATGVIVSDNLQITFDEIVYLNTGFVEIRYQSDDLIFESINVTSLTGDGTNTITINPSTDFDSETTYYVLIDPQAFMDDLGNGFAGISSSSDWVFTTEDIVAPTVINLTPDNVSDVSVTSDLQIEFSESITKNIGSITIMNQDSDVEHETIDVSGGQVTVSGNVATINPSVDFLGETNYYVLVGESTFQDLSGNNFGGILSPSEWTFYTQDVIPPVDTNLAPLDNATDVLISSNLVIQFNETVYPGSGYITIVDADAATNFEVISITDANVSFSGNEITIDPTADFDGLTNYYVLIEATAIEDVFGNTYSGISDPTVWNFTTADGTAPVASIYSPADNATDVSVYSNLVITFSEIVKAGSGNITIVNADEASNHEVIDITGPRVTFGTNQVTIDPTTDLSGVTNYYVLIDPTAIVDNWGNSYAGISNNTTWNFTTIDITAPVVSNLSPADNTTGLSNSFDLIITFSENVVKNSGNITVYNATTATTHETVDVNSTNVNISSNVVTVTITNAFSDLNNYYVQIDNGAFQDLDGNSYSGITDNISWNFGIGDNTAPSVISVTPLDNATGVSLSTNLIIEFNESVFANAGNITIINSETSATHLAVDVSAATISGSTVTINPGIDFEELTAYHILIDNDVFRDGAGNSYAGISDNTSWNFTTADNTVPAISSLYPADGSTAVDVNTSLQIIFSESVVANTGLINIMNGTSIHESIDILSGQVEIIADTMNIIPGIVLEGETDYHVLIENDALHDLSGNSFAGITDPTVWNFNTEDISQPTVTITSEASGTVNDNFTITVTFSEAVTGFTVDDITVVNANIVSFDETTAGTVWTVGVEPIASGEVTVNINAGVAQDAAGNDNIAADQFSVTYDSGVGFEDILPFEISVYSYENKVVVDFENSENHKFEKGKIEIYNLVGQKITEQDIHELVKFETEVEHVSQIYLVKVTVDDLEYTKQLFIE